MDNNLMYKIGSDWVFDVHEKTGYYVVKENGKAVKFEKAFVIRRGTKIYMEIPAGVVRKARHLLDLQRQGKLDTITEQQ